MKQIHRFTGILVSFFIVAHLFNHLMAWHGIATHQALLDNFRIFYRNPFVEVILIGSFLFQSYSGIMLFINLRKKESKTVADKIQMYSGLVLGLFIIQHISATIGQRLYFELDTNFYFAARVVLLSPVKYYFIPYYFLGIMSFATHIANTHRTKMTPIVGFNKANIHFYMIVTFFAVAACMILYIFMGGHYPINIPAKYNVY